MPLVNSPPTTAVDTQDKLGKIMPPSEGWRNFFQQVYSVCNALTLSGTTAQRPTVGLWIGRTYFDTALGIPIWVQSTGPTVWVDATGVPV